MSSENSGTQDNQYVPGQQDTTSETKTLAEILRIAIDQWVRSNLNIWLPGQVVKVRSNSFVDVQPQIKEMFKVQGLVTLPVLQNVPIEHPRGSKWWVKLPVQEGDFGRINFCDRSLDNWIVSGGIVDPEDIRMHSLSDATFTPGLYPMSDVLPGNPTDMVLHNDQAEIYLQPAGKFKILSVASGQELFSNLITLVETLTTASTVAGGPFINSVVEQLTQLVENLTEMQGD